MLSAGHFFIVSTGFSALQGFFRKGKVLLEMGRGAEALLAWEHCLTLCPHFQPAQSEMEKVRGPVLLHGPVPSCHSGRCPVPLKDSCPSRSCCCGLILGASEVGFWAMSFPCPNTSLLKAVTGDLVPFHFGVTQASTHLCAKILSPLGLLAVSPA